ncbi:cold-shock protein [Boudabousia liubingyangii]|uniref:Cold-shock protein n=1 Tax=Boudabousia liubingyangii TaxID=1921764 RepID=A0A1Q5PLB8_9ACTO|nr:cold shock domain-containing protein [Boudabousia liubingyangii]OKL47083.1 cold-shock protein [Boudabousia liubingyangii]OKL47854.1 cold-shock protein [Boudabousia liubingyangii]
MPRGKVKWFDAKKGFGYVTSEDTGDVFLHISNLPEGTTSLTPGTRVDFSFVSGHKGPQVLSLTVLEEAPAPKRDRKNPAEVVVRVEDLIKLLDEASVTLQNGRYPSNSRNIAKALRLVATDFDY